MFWGIFFIGIGIAIIVNLVFGVSIPIVKTLLGLFLIYLGLKIIFGGFGVQINKKVSNSKEAIFSESDFSVDADSDKQEFTTIFGSSQLDLTNIKIEDLPKRLKFDTVFGSHRLKVSKEIPLIVKASSAFGQVNLPDNNRTHLGSFTYRSPGLKEGDPALTLIVNAVFGRFDLIVQ